MKIRLNEITWMRTILAVLIVFMHSFTCYNHSWPEPEGFMDISAYKWLNRIAFSFTLEAFVFISGYLFAFQRITLKRDVGRGKFLYAKFKRLIVPSIVFSLLYFLLFYDYKGLPNFVYSIINGCGHMWYLPMLFWCFLGGWILETIPVKDSWKTGLLIVLNLFTLISLPLRLERTAIFLFYFYGGYLVYKYSVIIKPKINSSKVILYWIVFAVSFIFLRPLRDHLLRVESDPLYLQVVVSISSRTCQLIYATLGIIAFFCSSVWYTKKQELSNFSIKLSGCCFGIYLIHQFILKYLYYKTGVPVVVGPYWLPWLGFTLTIISSYYISLGLLKTKIGKFLIG